MRGKIDYIQKTRGEGEGEEYFYANLHRSYGTPVQRGKERKKELGGE